jgi:hypothetical protein
MANGLLGGGHRRNRMVRLLVPVTALSGKTYPAGTEVRVAGSGPSVDGLVEGDWLPLSWWEYAESDARELPSEPELG